MRAKLVLGVIILSAAGGCTEKAVDKGTNRSHEPSGPQESKAMTLLTLPDFVVVDRCDAIYRKFGTEDLKDTLAYLGTTVGLEVGGQYVEIAPAEQALIYRRTETFTTSRDEQSIFRLTMVAGTSTDNQQKRKTAEIEISGCPPLNAGKPRIEVSVQIGGIPPTKIRGDVSIWAKETITGTDLMVRKINESK
jgi:molecular chaperone DnaK (HSP70)